MIPMTAPSAPFRRAAELIRQASDPTRLAVLLLLVGGERNVSEMLIELATPSQPALSHHLAILRHGQLIEPCRRGHHNIYALTAAGRALAAVAGRLVAA
jgi:DNA-binding transcriptional ArsR family regulator